jgi:hypothetical protein
MGTRSTIALEFADGTVEQVYCHWDGYLDHNGAILRDNYTDPFKLRDLIDLGDMSSLGPNIGEKHDFDIQAKYGTPEYEAEAEAKRQMCTFYGRDRGEMNTKARKYANAQVYFNEAQQEEYDYILRNIEGTATWFVRCYSTDGAWIELHEAEALEKVAA